ncbi:TPA: AIPR family protein [Klebsiella pneumoniae subsp. pneumoniae]|uniref:AIPR family protein n=1 Tax=Klebsiella pneumoniae TaxID=573 RepID=UPI001909EF15|nr:AIPR family protein [Klebsiella pneumoniae]HDU4800453.1 AIPR family protein [Klebsiella pneumoniae subsp. pneumoniae]
MSEFTNSQIIMEKIIKEEAAEQGESFSDYFELYTASQILKDYDVTYSDIEYSIVGDGGDGGVDSFYTFLNGELIKEDTDYSKTGKHNKIEVVIIQSKTSKSFGEDAIIKFNEVTRDLFNISTNISSDSLKRRYNDDLRGRVSIFRDVYSNLMKSFPDLTFSYYYSTLGEEIHPNVVDKGNILKETILKMFTGSKFSLEFVGASNLVELNRKVKSTSRMMELAESPIATVSGSYLCLVNLKKYYDFISDNDSLSRSIFESNVRDHNGDVVVNLSIQETLTSGKEDFWFLNNGVTVITSKAVLSGKTLTIENPQVVNGLQTSHEIYNYFSNLDDTAQEVRNLLVRVICEGNAESRDKIIRATNSQTSIPPASLRSADVIHRDIEDFFKANGYFYDRRKNFYKNEGKPASRIVSIPYLSQCVITTVLLQPNNARARPSTLINDNTRYEQIFNKKYPLSLYLNSYLILKRCTELLKAYSFDSKRDFNNVIYHTAMAVVLKLAIADEKQSNMPRFVSGFDSVRITDEYFRDVFSLVLNEYQKLGADDTAAKGTDFVTNIIKSLEKPMDAEHSPQAE